MAGIVKLKRTYTPSKVFSLSELVEEGELGINITDKKIFVRNNSNVIVDLTTHTHTTLPTQDMYDAMVNANSASASNAFLVESDLVGGLPTGEIPNNFSNFDGDPDGGPYAPQETQSPHEDWQDITGMDIGVTTASAVPIQVSFSFAVSRGSGSNISASCRVARLVAGVPTFFSLGMPVFVDSASARSSSTVTYRTPALPAGTYIF